MIFQRERNACPVCFQGDRCIPRKKYSKGKNFFTLYECQECSVHFWVPFKNPGSGWYEKESQNAVRAILKPKISRAYHKKFLQRFGSALGGKKLLDVGCGTGEFLAAALERGAEVWGVDFNGAAISIAKRHFQLKNIYAMSLEDFFQHVQTESFDFVTCFEVIEHSDNPSDLMRNLAQKLLPGGMLAMSTPSRSRLLPDWNTWDFPPNHLTRWDEKSIVKLFRSMNLEVTFCSYLEQFRILLEAINGKFRFGLVQKAQNFSQNEIANSLLTRIFFLLGLLKEYMFGVLPALPLWILSVIEGRKGGIMYIEAQKKSP